MTTQQFCACGLKLDVFHVAITSGHYASQNPSVTEHMIAHDPLRRIGLTDENNNRFLMDGRQLNEHFSTCKFHQIKKNE
jgi:hypothetical protein